MSDTFQGVGFYVYVWLREKDGTFPKGSAYYIGKTVHRKRVVGEHHNVKPPKNKANIRMLDCATESDALKLEKLLIRIYGRVNTGTGCLRNLTDGGEGVSGLVFSAEHRAKNSAAKMGNKCHFGHKHTAETRARLRAASTGNKNRVGRKPTAEACAKISAALKGRVLTTDHRAKIIAANAAKKGHKYNLGRKPSAETRAKMSAAHTGKVLSAEALARLRQMAPQNFRKARCVRWHINRGIIKSDCEFCISNHRAA